MKHNIIYICFCIILFITKINSQSLSLNEELCLNNFLNVIGVTNPPSDLCTVSGINCQKNVSSSLNYVKSISITQSSNVEILSSQVACFSNLESFYIKNCYLNFLFFSGSYSTTFKTFACDSCSGASFSNLFTQPVSSTFTSIAINNLQQSNVSFQLDFSKIKTLESFQFQVNLNFLITSNITLNNDLVSLGPSIFPSTFISTSINLPSVTNLNSLSTFQIVSYNPVSYSNLTTFTQVKSIDFYVSSSISDFPPFSQISVPNNLEYIGSRANYNSVANKIDLTNLINLKEINLRDAYSFHSNYEIPFLPHPTLERFQLVGAISVDPKPFIIACPKLTSFKALYNQLSFNFSDWNYSQISRLTTLDLSYTNIVGSIDSSFCQIPELNVRGCKLSGLIPSCISCYLGGYSYFFENNQFTNFNPIPACTTIVPNLWYNSSESILYIYGNDIGLTSSDLKLAAPYNNLVPIVVKRSKMFKIPMTSSQIKPTFDVIFNAKSTSGIMNQTFTLSTSPTSPIIENIIPTASQLKLEFKGSYFSYNSTSIRITASGSDCIVTSSTFSTIACTLPNSFDFTQKNVLISFSIDDNSLYGSNQNPPSPLTNSFFINMNYENKMCVNGCGPNEYCDQAKGTCMCNSGFTRSDPTLACEEMKCPNNCSNAGTCSFGVCTCNLDRVYLDCSGYNCVNGCLNGGTCDNSNGKCKCPSNYTYSDCSVPSHYVTSIIPCSIEGGNVTLFGLFPDTDYTVQIGSLNCQILDKKINQIICSLNAGTGIQNVKVINSKYNIPFIGIGIFNYYNPIKACPNDCTSSSNGICDNVLGICNCLELYTSFDCSIKKELIESAPVVNTTIDVKTATFQMNSKETVYKIGVVSLNEISIDGSIVAIHPLQDNWSLLDSSSTDNIYTFEQQIDEISKISYTIEEIKLKDKEFTFGSMKFIVPKDGIKLGLNISNYQYKNSLNTLTLSFISGASNENNNNNKQDSCNNKETSIDTSNADNQNDVNYISIYKNSRQLVGRFINMVIADGKETFMSSTFNKSNNDNGDNNIIINANLPHCKNSCLIDPDFSILVTPDFKSKCSNDKKNWLIPVAVVIPCVGAFIIVTASIIIFKKNRYNLKIISFKLKNLKK